MVLAMHKCKCAEHAGSPHAPHAYDCHFQFEADTLEAKLAVAMGQPIPRLTASALIRFIKRNSR